MPSLRLSVVTVYALAAITAAPMTNGDGPCNKGFRDSTTAERATMTAVLQVVKNALPPAPAGWVIVGDDQISVTRSVCRDYEGVPWGYEFTRYYQHVDDQEARNKIVADAGAAAAAAMQQKQPRLDAAMARVTRIVQARGALVQKGDIAGAQAMNPSLAKAQADYQKIANEGDSAAQMAAATAEASRDLTMSIFVRVNSDEEAPDADARNFQPPLGARAAFRRSTGREGVAEDQVLILLGGWQANAAGTWKQVRHPELTPTAARVMTIDITADPERLAGTIGAIDVNSIAAKLPK